MIPHGAFDYLTRLLRRAAAARRAGGAEGPVILFFGLLRLYKGVEVLLQAFRDVPGAELWVVGNPRMPSAPLRELAATSAGTVRFVPRFVDEAEIPAIFRRADVVALPYLDGEHSGVLYTALAFGSAIVASEVGGFPSWPPAPAPPGSFPRRGAGARRGPARARRGRRLEGRDGGGGPARRGRRVLLGLGGGRDPRALRAPSRLPLRR